MSRYGKLNRRGSKKTLGEVTVGVVNGAPSLQVNQGGNIYAVPLTLGGAANEKTTSNLSDLRVSGNAIFDSGDTVVSITSDGFKIGTTELQIGVADNVIMGSSNPARRQNTTFNKNNVVIGHNAGLGVLTEDTHTYTNNVCIGFNAMRDVDPATHDVNANSNVAIGHSAMQNAWGGDRNTAVGAGALLNNDGAGDSNVCIGYTAGANITSGSNNVVIGDAGVPTHDADSQLVIADGDGGVTWIQGASDGKVGISGLTWDGSIA